MCVTLITRGREDVATREIGRVARVACDEVVGRELFEPVREVRSAGGAVKAMKGGHTADEAMSVPCAKLGNAPCSAMGCNLQI